MTIKAFVLIVRQINLKTIIFNFQHFPFSVAYKLPVYLHHNVRIKKVSGKIILPDKVSSGMIKIGYGHIGIYDKKLSKAVLEIKGELCFEGKAFIGHGAKISIGESGRLTFGENFNLTAESSIICYYKISFGADCLLSWDILVMDTDFHKIIQGGKVINSNREILIGNNVWIGARCTILKGSKIADGCIIAATSTISNSFETPQCILGGTPTRIMKEDISWTF